MSDNESDSAKSNAEAASQVAVSSTSDQAGPPSYRNADLRQSDLSVLQLAGKDASGADFRGCNLSGVDLSGTVLTGADLRAADLSRADLRSANLANARLRDANLQGARLATDGKEEDNVRGLMAHQLSGCDLQGAVLPDGIARFDSLPRIQEACQSATTLFVSLLVACGYSVLTLATATDPALLTNSGSLSLPLLNAPIQLSYFFLVTPFLLGAVYCYFHAHLQRMWEALAEMPAVFPDGVTLDRKVHPWIPTSLVCSYMPHLRPRRSALHGLGFCIAVPLLWWGVPLLILLFWLRYLTKHSGEATYYHAGLTALGLLVALSLRANMAETPYPHLIRVQGGEMRPLGSNPR